jgi:hypothetical protein
VENTTTMGCNARKTNKQTNNNNNKELLSMSVGKSLLEM